jgi:AraC family transcriptional regulator
MARRASQSVHQFDRSASLAPSEGRVLAGQRAYIVRPFAEEATQTHSMTAQLAAPRANWSIRDIGMSPPLQVGRAYILRLQRQGRKEPSKNGRHIWRARFYISQIAFDELAEDGGVSPVSELAEAVALDAVVRHSARAPVLANENQTLAGSLCAEHFAVAIYPRFDSNLDDSRGQPIAFKTFLTASQEQKAKEQLVADLRSPPSIVAVADACGFPVRRFLRAFRKATGMPPHRWLRAFRVERAKALLQRSPLPLAQVAYDCGFADQSHLTRVFAAAVGTTPGAWRLAHRHWLEASTRPSSLQNGLSGPAQ